MIIFCPLGLLIKNKHSRKFHCIQISNIISFSEEVKLFGLEYLKEQPNRIWVVLIKKGRFKIPEKETLHYNIIFTNKNFNPIMTKIKIDKNTFFEDVFEVVKLIPKGRVTSYGAIAKYLGIKSSARMVGWAMNSAHGLKGIPAHRVVNRNGLLTGKHHFETPDQMQKLLEKEGIEVIKDQIQNFDKHFWDPGKELL